MLLRAGDIAWVEFGPVEGSEQDRRRPALLLTDIEYHEVSGRAVVCPISSTERPWPFNVPLPDGIATTGVVLIDQIQTVDRAARMFDFIEHVPDDVLSRVRDRVAALLGFDAVLSHSG